MSENDIPKLFINANPGALLTGRVRDYYRTWKNQAEATAKADILFKRTSGPEIGRLIKAWLPALSFS